jgi:DDE superfamily endonuclease
MGYPTKVQLIRRKQSQQWYVNFPAQVAQAMDFRAGEVVEWQIEDRGLLGLVRRQVPESALKKKTAGLLPELERLGELSRGAFPQARTAQRWRVQLLSQLVGLGRHTVTGNLCTAGRQFENWNPDYRQFSQARVDADVIAGVILRENLDQQAPTGPVVAAMDDSIMRKRGKKTPGVAWRRDPLGPPFQVNLVRGQRFLQISLALPQNQAPGPARMIPFDFRHAPTPQKPKKSAEPREWKLYRQAQNQTNLTRQGARRVKRLRGFLDRDPAAAPRPLWVTVDGRFTNKNLLRNLPDNTQLIGRIRMDAKLFFPPESSQQPKAAGRKKTYGKIAPTPEQLRADPGVPWLTVPVFAAGKIHDFKIKTLGPILWKTAGAQKPLRLIVIAPLAYRPRKGNRLLYRQPAFLISTNLDAPLDAQLQAFVWRWEIELNFRDEKQIIGVGEAQVRNSNSVQTQPEFATFAYAFLLLAANRALNQLGQTLPLPKWRKPRPQPRTSTQGLIHQLRAELWGRALGVENFGDFIKETGHDLKPQKLTPHLPSAVLYASA